MSHGEAATVCMPWRHRTKQAPIQDRCVQFWTDNGFPVITADSDPALPFLANQARNNAVRRATTPVVILADADTIPDDIAQVHTAIEYAKQGCMVWPHTVQRYIDSSWATSAEPLKTAPARVECGSYSGSLMVISRLTFWGIGGFDERFTPGVGGWDDMAFSMTAATLLKVVRVEGCSWAFEIADDHFCDNTPRNPNWSRYLLYATANKQGEKAMRELLRTRPEVPYERAH
jgi:hypothetical protein